MKILTYWHQIRKQLTKELIAKVTILNILYMIIVSVTSGVVTLNAIMTIYYFLISQTASVLANNIFWWYWIAKSEIDRWLKFVIIVGMIVVMCIVIFILLWGGAEALNFM